MSEIKQPDLVLILNAASEMPFNSGRNLLIDVLRGEASESVARNKLSKLASFGSMAYERAELHSAIDKLIRKGMLEASKTGVYKVLKITPEGEEAIENPQKLTETHRFEATKITEQDKALFAALGNLLEKYNNEQKKAIITPAAKVLCIAGAGSGKTAVLTKRIEFLTRYRSFDENKILAITFTRKAKQEMQKRLSGINARIETFNSFCEGILRAHNNLAYGKPVRVISYRDKFEIIAKALSSLNLTMEQAVNTYFASTQGKTQEQLAITLVNDCFTIRDYLKSTSTPAKSVLNEGEASILVSKICSFIEHYLAAEGLRDFEDQLLDALKLFEDHPELTPQFEHILIDEFQDVNATQMKLVKALNPKNIFLVGDPRQAIYGWRGSDVRHILNFPEKNPQSEVIVLTKNYRSLKSIITLANNTLADFPKLEAAANNEGEAKLIGFESEEQEFAYVIEKILAIEIPRNEIFVLARTNRQLKELSEKMKQKKIAHVVRSDEVRRTVLAGQDDVTLATVHAIKGLEAKMVFVIGCTSSNFPIKTSEHPVVEMVKMNDYDKEEEEKRLLYVAISRAKESLHLTYHGKKHTDFINIPMKKLLNGKTQTTLAERLKTWRAELCEQHNIPAYLIINDRTLIDIAQKKPLTRPELEQIHGIGPNKIMRFGDEILNIVAGK